MRQVVLAAIALVLGLVLGGLGPRAEVRELEEKLLAVVEAPCADEGMGRDLARLLGGAAVNRPAPRGPDPEEMAAADPEAAALAEDLREAQREAQDGLREGMGEVADARDELDLMRSALELRRVQARAAMLEDADPSDAQLDDFDAAIEDMNVELRGLAEELVDLVNAGEEPTRRDAMSFAADALDTLIAAEDRMGDALDPDQLAAVADESVDPFSYVDPGLLDLLEELDSQ